jgi:hypothetical protein
MTTNKETESTIIVQVNAETGETIERPLNPEEITERAEMQKKEKTRQKEQEAKAEARASALAKLAALGLTEAEIASL